MRIDFITSRTVLVLVEITGDPRDLILLLLYCHNQVSAFCEIRHLDFSFTFSQLMKHLRNYSEWKNLIIVSRKDLKKRIKTKKSARANA